MCLWPWLTPEDKSLDLGVGRSHLPEHKQQGCPLSNIFISGFCFCFSFFLPLNPKRKMKGKLMYHSH